MSNLLEQLESPEAVLLMYVADELPAADRAEVERKLAADPRLRAQLERVRDAYAGFATAMQAADESARLSVPQAVGVQRVVRSIRKWHAGRIVRTPAQAEVPTLRYPWWAYPLAAAASVVIAFLVWWGNADRPDDRLIGRNLPLHFDSDERPSTNDMLAAMIFATSGPVDPPEEFASLVDPSDYAILAPLMEENEPVGPPADAAPGDTEREQDDWFLYL